MTPMHDRLPLRIDVLTLFPGMFSGVIGESMLKRAREAGALEVYLHNFRDHGIGRHLKVDDEPYGGGPGLVLRCEPIFGALNALLADESLKQTRGEPRLVMLTPQGRQLKQAALRSMDRELADSGNWIVMLCGHYEGFDERIRQGFAWDEISIGDYVLTGGELPAMVLIDGLARLQPGVLGDAESASEESFEGGLLEYPQYTRPPEFQGMKVPDVLVSGHHGKVAEWRKQEALKRTRERRPDLLK